MAAIQIFKRLFCFKKPRVIQLGYIPVLVKDKPVLLVAWEIKHAWRVKFIPIGRRYYAAQHAVMLSIPNNLNQVTIKVANYWRRTTIRLPLQIVQLDEAATAQLIHGFRPLNRTEISTPQVSHIKHRAFIKPLTIQQRNSAIKEINRFTIHIKPLPLRIQPFNYHK